MRFYLLVPCSDFFFTALNALYSARAWLTGRFLSLPSVHQSDTNVRPSLASTNLSRAQCVAPNMAFSVDSGAPVRPVLARLLHPSAKQPPGGFVVKMVA